MSGSCHQSGQVICVENAPQQASIANGALCNERWHMALN